MSATPECIRLFDYYLATDEDLRQARKAVRDAEATGDCTAELKDAVIACERARAEAERAHDKVSRETCRKIVNEARR